MPTAAARSIPTETGDYRGFYAGIARAIAEERAVPVSGEDAVLELRIMEMARKARARGGSWRSEPDFNPRRRPRRRMTSEEITGRHPCVSAPRASPGRWRCPSPKCPASPARVPPAIFQLLLGRVPGREQARIDLERNLLRAAPGASSSLSNAASRFGASQPGAGDIELGHCLAACALPMLRTVKLAADRSAVGAGAARIGEARVAEARARRRSAGVSPWRRTICSRPPAPSGHSRYRPCFGRGGLGQLVEAAPGSVAGRRPEGLPCRTAGWRSRCRPVVPGCQAAEDGGDLCRAQGVSTGPPVSSTTTVLGLALASAAATSSSWPSSLSVSARRTPRRPIAWRRRSRHQSLFSLRGGCGGIAAIERRPPWRWAPAL